MTVGVAVALYNGARFIGPQLDSIRNQTLEPNRVVLCDDGSNDGTIEIVTSYIEKYALQDKWTLIQNEDNLGYARNFYKAMRLCETDIIFLCDQDDLWKENKIERMTDVMNRHPDILLLASKFGMIDENGNALHGILEKKTSETGKIRKIGHKELLSAFYWPGMIMAVKKDFFCEIFETIRPHKVAHDRVLAHFAAESNGFYEYDYISSYHRRHGNNTANEEHRIFKLLNLKRKLRDMKDHIDMLEGLLNIPLPFSKKSVDLIAASLEFSKMREKAVRNKDLKLLNKIYRNNEMARKVSYICDVWLIFFGK